MHLNMGYNTSSGGSVTIQRALTQQFKKKMKRGSLSPNVSYILLSCLNDQSQSSKVGQKFSIIFYC